VIAADSDDFADSEYGNFVDSVSVVVVDLVSVEDAAYGDSDDFVLDRVEEGDGVLASDGQHWGFVMGDPVEQYLEGIHSVHRDYAGNRN